MEDDLIDVALVVSSGQYSKQPFELVRVREDGTFDHPFTGLVEKRSGPPLKISRTVLYERLLSDTLFRPPLESLDHPSSIIVAMAKRYGDMNDQGMSRWSVFYGMTPDSMKLWVAHRDVRWLSVERSTSIVI